MDYLDRKKELREHVLLIVGYVLVGVAIAVAAMVLLYQAYGFSLDRQGAVIQRGLTFFSSHPSPADIYVGGKLQTVQTNTRLVLPAGIYDVKLVRDGYFDWERKIEVRGGKVLHYDYPFLFPKNLSTKKIASYTNAPGFSTQSPDHRWLLVQKPGSINDFDIYDLKNPDKAQPETLTLPENLLTKGASEGWQLGEWSADNRHVLLQHNYDGKAEFIIVDRDTPALSVNLNTLFAQSPAKVTLNDRKYDKYYLYDASGSLAKASLDNPRPTPVLQHVLAYKTYGSDTILYVTDNNAPAGKVLLKMLVGDTTYTIRKLPAGTTYVVDLTKYSGDMYVAAGAAADNRVYIYKDPVGQIKAEPKMAPVISQVLRVEQVNYLSFSSNAQFIMAENGNRFGVYDIENESGYNYVTPEPIDSPQSHATWMDGNRLVYVSQGKLLVFDYDYLNRHSLSAASSAYLPAFTPDYKMLYTLAPNSVGQLELDQTWLLTPPDR